MLPGHAARAPQRWVALAPPRARDRGLHGQVLPPGLAKLPSGRSQPLGRRTSWLRSVGKLIGREEAPAHPYLACQMSDLGFRQNP